MTWILWLFAILGLALAVGFKFWGVIPGFVRKGLAVLSIVTVGVLLWQVLSLPSVQILDTLVSWGWVIALSMSYTLGTLIVGFMEG